MKLLLLLLALASLSWSRMVDTDHSIDTWVKEMNGEGETEDTGSFDQDIKLQTVFSRLVEMMKSHHNTDQVTTTDFESFLDVMKDLKDVYEDKIQKEDVSDVGTDMKSFFDKIMDLKKEWEDKKQREGDMSTLPIDVQRTVLKPFLDKMKDTMNRFIGDTFKETDDTGRTSLGGDSLLERIVNTLIEISKTDQDSDEKEGTRVDLENFFDKMKDLKEMFEEKIRNGGVIDNRYDLGNFFDKIMGLKIVYEDKKHKDVEMGRQGDEKTEIKQFFDTIKLLKNVYIGGTRKGWGFGRRPSSYGRSELQRFFNDVKALKKLHDDRIQKEVDMGRRPYGIGPSDLQRFYDDIILLKKIYDEKNSHMDSGKSMEGDNSDVTIIMWNIKSPLSDSV